MASESFFPPRRRATQREITASTVTDTLDPWRWVPSMSVHGVSANCGHGLFTSKVVELLDVTSRAGGRETVTTYARTYSGSLYRLGRESGY